MVNKQVIKEIITNFHKRTLPHVYRRKINLSCPENKIRSIVGIRRSGKTFTFYQLIKDLLKQGIKKERILCINFEDERLLPLNVADLTIIFDTYFELFPLFKNKKVYLFFDEIQNISNWEKFIRRIHESENVEINITGSSSKLMSRELATALRGRTLSYEIFPFSFEEYCEYKNIPSDLNSSAGKALIVSAFDKYMFNGGFPEILNCSEEFRIKILQEYINLILYKELIDRYEIRNHSLIKYLLKFLLINNANPFSVNKFYNDLKSQGYRCSKETLHNYLSYFEDSYCFSSVPVFAESLRKKQVNYRKVYCVDHGLVTAMTSSLSYNTGGLLESMVYNQLRRIFHKEQINYYKTSKGEEVDFIVKERGIIRELIQVCEDLTFPDTRKREVKSMIRAMEELALSDATIITRYERETISQGNKTIRIVPFYVWSLEKMA
ncbi:ATP-binding protein [bacterium]|nr:ATP-binding protein [bacterium]